MSLAFWSSPATSSVSVVPFTWPVAMCSANTGFFDPCAIAFFTTSFRTFRYAEFSRGLSGPASSFNNYLQFLLFAFSTARNVMLAGAKLTRPALVGSPVNWGNSPPAVSRSVFSLSWTDVSSSCFAVNV